MSIDKPEAGDVNWDGPLNAALDELDARETVGGAQSKATAAYVAATEYSDARLGDVALTQGPKGDPGDPGPPGSDGGQGTPGIVDDHTLADRITNGDETNTALTAKIVAVVASVIVSAGAVLDALNTWLDGVLPGRISNAGATRDAVDGRVTTVLAADPTPANAAAAAVTTALGLAAVLTQPQLPVLGENRGVDPQGKNSGVSESNVLYTLSHITTGLPTGFVSGLKTVRASTLSAVISQMYFGSKTAGNAYLWPVTPAEVVSVAALLWTDQAGARSRVDALFYKSDGTLISTVSGTYANIAASTWTQNNKANITVPALAAYVALRGTVSTISGNTVTGAEARMTGGQLVSGNVAAPVYGDGTSSGWVWTGVAHQSASRRLFLSVTEYGDLATMGDPLRLTKVGNALTITTALDDAHTLVHTAGLTSSANGAFGFTGVAVDGSTVHVTSDDVCPIRTQMGTIGGNHGYANVASFTNPDAKAAADLGSVWQDTAGRQYVLLAITGGRLFMGGDYTSPGGVTTSADVNPVTNLTHVSGATHTAAIDYTTRISDQLLPSINNIVTTVFLDDAPITADGLHQGNTVTVRETYSIMDYASIYDLAKANIGVSYTTLAVATAVRVQNTFKWTSGVCHITTQLLEIAPTTLLACGGVQSAPMSLSGATLTRYLPGVGLVAGNNWTTGVDMTSYSTSSTLTTAHEITSGKPPAFSLETLTASGAPVVGFAFGYLPYGKRGDESSLSATRQTKAASGLWDMRSTKKQYPAFTVGEAAGWGRLTAESFRAYLSPAQCATVVANAASATRGFASLDAARGITL